MSYFKSSGKIEKACLVTANEMLDKHFMDDKDIDFYDEIQDIQKKIEVLNKKFDNLVDMRMEGEIDKAKFNEKKIY